MSWIRRRRQITAALVVVVAVAAILGWSGTSNGSDLPPDRAVEAAFSEVFTERQRIHLRESPQQPVGAISAVAFGPQRRLAVADRQSDRVFVFNRRGTLQGIVGRPGEGPGEFEDPTDIIFDASGRLYVADAGAPHIIRYDAGLAPDSIIRLDEAFYALRLARSGKNLLAYVNAPGLRTPRLRLLQPDGKPIDRFHPSHPAYLETPYWSAATSRVLAASSERVVAGGNLIYPLALYTSDGTFLDSIGHAPRRWRQAPRPERGAFRGPDRLREFARWRRTFTTIQGVALLEDRYLVVSHEHLDPDVLAYEDGEYFADVYDLRSREKRWTDVKLPGRVLIGGQHLTVLVQRPPYGWVLGTYEVAE